MARVFGDEVSTHLKSIYGSKVNVEFGSGIDEIVGSGDRATSVWLANGKRLPADLVLIGTGIKPSTEFLGDSGLNLEKDGGVTVDPFHQTSSEGIYAAGDVASIPYFLTGQRMRIEHYVWAMESGSNAAYNMLGKNIPFTTVPFFWSRAFNKGIQYIGHATSWDEIHVDGSIKDEKFLAFYIKGGKVLAVSAMGRVRDMTILSEAFKQGKMPSGDDIKSGKLDTNAMLASLKATKGFGCKRAQCCKKKAQRTH